MTEQTIKRGRGRPKGSKNPNAKGRPPLPMEERRKETDVMFDPGILAAVEAYANAGGISRSEAVNRLLAMGLAQK